MERIKKIYQSFSRTEQRYLKAYLEAFHSKGENKALKVIQLIEKDPSLTSHDLATLLYGNPTTKAFLMMKSRLLDRMLDVLTLSTNLSSNPLYKEDPPTLELIQMYKSYTHAILLRKRGLDDLAEEILLKLSKQSQEFDLPELRLLSLLQLRNLSTSPDEVSWGYKKAIEQALRQYENDILGVGYYDEFRVKHADISSGDQDAITYLEGATTQLEKLLESEYSVRAHYYYLNLTVTLTQLRHEYEKCREALRELIDLLNSHSGLNAKYRKGIPYLRLARLDMKMHQFENAYVASRKALDIFPSNRTNYRSAAVYHIFSCIYSDHLEDALQTLSSLPQSEVNTLTQSADILKYLESCIQFAKGNMSGAKGALQEADKLLSDKSGWNIGMRIYELIILLEIGEEDLAISRIENLRKHIMRYGSKSREAIIYRYFNQLEKQGFDLSSPNEEMKSYLEKMEASFPWQPVSHEVVKFDSWIRSKIEESPFILLS